MIRYALACDEGHGFDSWFPSAAAYDAQAASGLVTCPACGSARVAKAIMAPSVSTAGPSRPVPAATDASAPREAPPEPVAILSERERAVRTMLREIRQHVTRSADYVGPRFAAEARRMHEGEIEHRSIYGEATAMDARALAEDGIEFHPLPAVPDDRN